MMDGNIDVLGSIPVSGMAPIDTLANKTISLKSLNPSTGAVQSRYLLAGLSPRVIGERPAGRCSCVAIIPGLTALAKAR